MNRTQSEHTQTLPRIRSQGKFARAVTQLGEKAKEDDPARSEEKRALTRLSSQRRNLQSANISKAVRYQATNAIYLKKIQALQKQNYLLDRQIVSVNQQISLLRIKKKTNDDSKTISSRLSQISKRTVIGNEPNGGRIEALRKKVDKENQKNKQMQNEIDQARREIITTKRLNEQLSTDLKGITQKLENQNKNAAKMEEEISIAKEELKKKKIELIHQKTHLIKNYDLILKKLDQDLANAPISDSRAINTNLYLTDVYLTSKPAKRIKQLTENSPKSKKTALQLNHFKERIQQCEKHFQELKSATGCQSIEEAISKLSQGYQQNFRKYQFLNERHARLQELKERNVDLNRQREETEELAHKTSRSACGCVKIQEQIKDLHRQKSQIKYKIQQNQQYFSLLKEFACEAMHRIPQGKLQQKYQIDKFTDCSLIITKDNLQQFLDQILTVKLQLSRKSTKQTSLGRSQARGTLQQYLQHARREGAQERERLLEREQMMQVNRNINKSKMARN